MIIEVINKDFLSSDKKVSYNIPSKDELLAYSEKTWGKKFDRVEHELVEGGLPFVLQKI